MLAPLKVELVRRLLAQGNLSQRQIALAAGVSRGSVRNIESGQRLDYPIRPADGETNPYLLPPARCRGCGGFVYAPCRLCRVRKLKAIDRAIRQLHREGAFRAAG